MEFYYADPSGQAIGPVTQDQLESLLQSGGLHSQSLVAKVGESAWTTMADLFQIETIVEDVGPVFPTQLPTYQPAPDIPPSPPTPYLGKQPRVPFYGGPGSASVSALPSDTLGVLGGTPPWAYVTSIYWWLLTLSFLGVSGFLFYTAVQVPRGIGSMAQFMVVAGVAFLVMAVLSLLPAMQSWAFGSLLASLRSTPGYLEYACSKQATYFKTLAIYFIIMLSLTGFAMVAVFLASNSSSAGRRGVRAAPSYVNPSSL